jgi:FkbM family methyltransferase
MPSNAEPRTAAKISSPGASADAAAERALFFSRWGYYLSSIPTLLLRFRSWPRILGAFLGMSPKDPFLVELRAGGRYLVRGKMDIWVLKETCVDRDYERTTPLRDGWTVVDIGAGAGDFTISAALRGPRSKVYAFEPLAESFDLLEKNLALNEVSNVTAFPEAVAGQSGDLFLFTRSGVDGQHRTREAPDEGDSVPVRAVTLAEAFARSGIAVCDFLKIDCEGGEYDILFQASEEALARVRHIAMEYHDGVTSFSHRDLIPFLESRGFQVTRRGSPAHANIGFLFADNRRLPD